MLKLVNIKKDYKIAKEIVPALKDIDIEFRQNEFVAILGPSGCGKTTLLNIIGGLDKYSEGDLIIKGKSTKDYKDKDWDAYRNDSIGFVFQNYNLIPHLTVLGNVELALTLSGISKIERKKRAVKALKKVGLGDKLNKKPKHLSGGQMQRVAIARAIVNDPEIILADEPTGALDSKTSIQIMDILKEISKDKLIIMVTHNPELAESYANRTVKLLDGRVIEDTNPYNTDKEIEKVKNKKSKTSMSFFTALSLSFKNLLTKKTRTILTSIAGSIGIIGVALVLSLTNGFQKYVDKMQADTLSSYPILIEEEAVDISSVVSSVISTTPLDKFPSLKEVYVNKLMENRENMYTTNEITDEYIENVIEKIDPSLLNGISYGRDMRINFFTNNGEMKQVVNGEEYYVRLSTSVWQEMLSNIEFIDSQYDVLEGKLPQEKDEIVIVVDQYNRLTDSTLMSLGLYESGQEKDVYTFEELMDLEFKMLTNDEIYKFNGTKFVSNGMSNSVVTKEAYESGLTLKVVGIIRVDQNTAMGSLSAGIAYSSLLTDYMIEKNQNSQLITYMKENVNYSPFSGSLYVQQGTNGTPVEQQYHEDLVRYGGITTPTSIKIYPKDFNAKNEIKAYLDAYNATKDEKNRVVYTDIMDLIVKTINTMINTISYVLIAFTAISLIVSSIMIAIITYVSVIERTKEIGVLRSIGARKRDISTVFNAETFIIGLTAGVIGIIVTLLINIPINMVITSLVDGIGNISSLSLMHAIILILISIGLTLLSGFIPAKMAAKKDPVVALRSE